MRIGVTGASGFIGRPLVATLAPRHEVVALDRAARPLDGVRVVRGDVLDAASLRALRGVDAVVHLAAIANPRVAKADPARAHAVNVDGTRNVLDAVGGQAKVVLASTAQVYAPAKGRLGEDAPVQALEPYARSKLEAERLVMARGAGAYVARLFNVYGPGQSDEYVVGRVLAQVAAEDPVRLQTPHPVRDFIFVEDAVDAICAMVEADASGPEILNVGTGVGTSIGELAERALTAAGRTDQASFADVDSALPQAPIVADPRKAEKLIGWRARVPLDEGLRRCLTPP